MFVTCPAQFVPTASAILILIFVKYEVPHYINCSSLLFLPFNFQQLQIMCYHLLQYRKHDVQIWLSESGRFLCWSWYASAQNVIDVCKVSDKKRWFLMPEIFLSLYPTPLCGSPSPNPTCMRASLGANLLQHDANYAILEPTLNFSVARPPQKHQVCSINDSLSLITLKI